MAHGFPSARGCMVKRIELRSWGVEELRSLKSLGTNNSLAVKARVLSALFNLIGNSRNQGFYLPEFQIKYLLMKCFLNVLCNKIIYTTIKTTTQTGGTE